MATTEVATTLVGPTARKATPTTRRGMRQLCALDEPSGATRRHQCVRGTPKRPLHTAPIPALLARLAPQKLPHA